MGNDAKTPWSAKRALDLTGDVGILDKDGRLIVEVFHRPDSIARVDTKSRAAFIVRACNAHDALVAACEKFVEAHYPGGVDYADMTEFQAAIALATEANDDAPLD